MGGATHDSRNRKGESHFPREDGSLRETCWVGGTWQIVNWKYPMRSKISEPKILDRDGIGRLLRGWNHRHKLAESTGPNPEETRFFSSHVTWPRMAGKTIDHSKDSLPRPPRHDCLLISFLGSERRVRTKEENQPSVGKCQRGEWKRELQNGGNDRW